MKVRSTTLIMWVFIGHKKQKLAVLKFSIFILDFENLDLEIVCGVPTLVS